MPLAEGRRLQFVACGMAVEPEAALAGRRLEPIEMNVELGDPLVRVEAHDFFEIGRFLHGPHIHGKRACGQAPVALREVGALLNLYQ